MIAARLGRFLTMLLVLAFAVGGYASMEARSPLAAGGHALALTVDHDDWDGHGHSHDVDDDRQGSSGHEHTHDPFDHTHDVPTAAVETASLDTPPRTREAPRHDMALIPVPGPFPERPPRIAGRG